MYRRTIQSIFVAAATLISLPAGAQVYYGGVKSPAKAKAAEAAKATLKYDPHDLSGIWLHASRPADLPKNYPGVGDAHASQLMGGALPPPLTFWGLGAFIANKPSLETAWQSRRTIPAYGKRSGGKLRSFGLSPFPREVGS